jgi:hypothetical protein
MNWVLIRLCPYQPQILSFVSYAEATSSSCGAILPVYGSVFQVVVMIFNLRFNTN